MAFFMTVPYLSCPAQESSQQSAARTPATILPHPQPSQIAFDELDFAASLSAISGVRFSELLDRILALLE